MADLFNTNTASPQDKNEQATSPPLSSLGTKSLNQTYYRTKKPSSRLGVKIFAVLAVMLLLIGLPLSMLVSKTPQEQRTRAAGPTPTIPPTNGNGSSKQNLLHTRPACGTACNTSADCTNGTNNCTRCDLTTHLCSSPKPTICVTPLQVQNVKVSCPNCANPTP